MKFQLNIDMEKIKHHEKLLGHKYNLWTSEEKLDFIFYNLILDMDNFVVENSITLTDEVAERIETLKKYDFNLGYINSFLNPDSVLSREAVLYNNEKGIIYYLEATRAGNNPYGFNITRNNLMFQVRDYTPLELKSLLKEKYDIDKCFFSGGKGEDGADYTFVAIWHLSLELIENIMKEDLQFLPVWTIDFSGNEILNTNELILENSKLKMIASQKLNSFSEETKKIIRKSLF